MPRESSLVGSPHIPEILRLRRNGGTYESIARALDLPRGQVERWLRAHERARPARSIEPGWERPPTPDMAGLSTLDAARAHARWLHAMLTSAAAGGAAPKEVAALSAQYSSAMRLVGRLDGSLEITAAQILKSVDFQRLLAALEDAIGDDREVWARWEAALARMMGERAEGVGGGPGAETSDGETKA